LHGAEFDLRNGKSLTPPATEDAKVFAVTRDGDTVTISHK
jgi:nitrite reductase/ring-hydroxylating ferredoxin subunit